ncbi:MAG TPA: dihydrolipoamide acetyltransferase family protein [Dehalococcoidia bacterium]|nr:dihydrolipoamide acetyltransferase family protein [Dehalococcoidia bacterium]
MTVITMPQLGETVIEGTLLRWMKQPGESVVLDEAVCEIETEKVTAELPSPYAGTMGPQLVEEGETVEVGSPLCEIADASTPSKAPPNKPSEDSPAKSPAVEEPVVAEPAHAGVSNRRLEERGRFYSPVVLRLAEEHNLDLAALSGTGIEGRVTRRDVETYLETRTPEPPAAPTSQPTLAGAAAATVEREEDFETVRLTPTRKAISANLLRSTRESPQAWTMIEVDMTRVLERREEQRAAAERDEGIHLTLLPYFTQAICGALREHPELNARWDGNELQRFRSVNCGIAVAAPHGLVVPVIRDAQELSVIGLARKITDVANRARDRRLTVEDVQGGTFTVNNTGAFGSIASKPIVNYPEVAIITLERVVQRPVVTGGDAIAIRAMANVCLSFDHRALDGLEAGRFLTTLKERVET